MEQESRLRGFLIDLGVLAGTPLVVMSVRRRATALVVAEKTSMLPGIEPGDRFLVENVDKMDRPVRRGDLLVFDSWHHDEELIIKRVIAVPGDVLEIRRHEVLVNGEVLDEPYAIPPTHGVVGPLTMGEDDYFMMGDNRLNSCDSRAHGPAKRERILGRAFFRQRPFARMGFMGE